MYAAYSACRGNSQNVSSLDPPVADTGPPLNCGNTSQWKCWCLLVNDSTHMLIRCRRCIEQRLVVVMTPFTREASLISAAAKGLACGIADANANTDELQSCVSMQKLL